MHNIHKTLTSYKNTVPEAETSLNFLQGQQSITKLS